MFQKWNEEIKRLNADVKTVANCERAKKLRKKLLCIGLPLAIVGFVGTFVCFVLFATAGTDAFGRNGFSARLIVPFVLFFPSFVIGSIGLLIARTGFQIVVTGYAAELIDEAVGNQCTACGAAIDAENNFCQKCGAKRLKICSACNTANGIEANYCKNCGGRI